ncbi:hypothetical protein Amme_116_004 [Acidomonas methanolica NBRC 104435]|uniref:OmpA-like domain-containing protein n=2 Tax=Acidomonas methanolica TaxID=437 RepID=A0A023D827_ACIMT|nr:hypothetical protein EDC31_1524 [Acidomonas methanolica]GAJ30273.1 hypothetical protein Amme_116_004 [Acidomonas methanolica NBRC 104435]GEL00650.1 hypothetical protein AME01nite_31480 [Acidomonas methanolica NBRC 104435]
MNMRRVETGCALAESRRNGRVGLGLAAMLAVAPGLVGCAQGDAVQSVTGWWHQYEGGAIAQQRPPPPGAHQPYPHVGLTPTEAPEMPSASARTALTDQLKAERNFGRRLAAADGPLPVAPPKPAAPPGQNAAASGSSMTVAAAGGGPAPAQDWTMPAVTKFAPPPMRPGELPQIGPTPPPVPAFPGFDIPETAVGTPRSSPAYALADPHGVLIRFAQSSDQMLAGQEKSIGDALTGWKAGLPVYVTGFGDATSLAPDDQAASLRLALARAKNLAETVMLRHVRAADVHLAAAANGHFGRVSLVP